MFLEHYFNHMQIMVAQGRANIQAYCDNLGLIQQVDKMQTNQIPNPSWAIDNDYDLHVKILHTIQCITLPISLHHIKGHQDDDTPVEQLPYAAQLNICCNKQASVNLAMLPQQYQPHPALPTTYPHLQIKDQVIVRQYIEYYICEAHHLPSYDTYLTTKFKWLPNTTHQIEWQTTEYAMHKLTKANHIQIQKIIHEWTPT